MSASLAYQPVRTSDMNELQIAINNGKELRKVFCVTSRWNQLGRRHCRPQLETVAVSDTSSVLLVIVCFSWEALGSIVSAQALPVIISRRPYFTGCRCSEPCYAMFQLPICGIFDP